MRRSAAVVVVVGIVVAGCSAGQPLGAPSAPPTTVDPAIVDDWADAPSVEVGGLVVPIPTEAHRTAWGAGLTEVSGAHADECRRRTYEAIGEIVGGVWWGCESMWRWAFTWDQPPSTDDQASELIWTQEVTEHACLDDTLGAVLPDPPDFTAWVTDGGAWTAEADLPGTGTDEDLDPLVRACEEAAWLQWPLPAARADADRPTEVVAGFLSFDGRCLHVVDADGSRWLPIWPPDHLLLTLPRPGLLLFEVFDQASLDPDAPGEPPFLTPTNAARLEGYADPGITVETTVDGADLSSCDGTPFVVVSADAGL